MAGQQNEGAHQVQDLRRKLFGLAQTERQLQREIGHRVLSGLTVVDLTALRRDCRENQENLSCALIQLDAATP